MVTGTESVSRGGGGGGGRKRSRGGGSLDSRLHINLLELFLFVECASKTYRKVEHMID